jgi:mannose-1-phosphate guanylyltransferase
MYIVVMAGGKGTRFWPRSRATVPKQLLDIVGQKTMIQETVERVLPVASKDKILIVTNEEHVNDLKSQLPDIPDSNIIAEPVGRNTAPCICLAATRIHKHEPEEIMAVLPADHYIGDAKAFCNCLEKAAEVARSSNALVTIGISPQKPETGYGYIQFDEQSDSEQKGIHRVVRFHEKPDLKSAEEFLRQGNFLWNSGMFVWKVSAILNEIKEHLPEIYSNIVSVETLWETPKVKEAIASAYEKIKSVSIDYGVMEKSDNVLTLKGDFDWNDIGSWSAIHDISKKDEDSNEMRGDVISVDSKDVLVYSPKKLTAVVGLRDVIVVETDDALLVCAMDKAQDVRKVVDILEKKGRKEFL